MGERLDHLDGLAHLLRLACLLCLLPDLAVHILEDEGHGDKICYLRLLHVLRDVLQALAERDGAALVHGSQHRSRKFERMVHGEQGQTDLAVLKAVQFHVFVQRAHVVGQIALAEHNALRQAGRAGRKDEGAEILRIHGQLGVVVRAHGTQGLALVAQFAPGQHVFFVFCQVHADELDVVHPLQRLFHLRADLRRIDDGGDVRASGQGRYFLHRKFLVEGHDDPQTAGHGEIRNDPFVAALANDGDVLILVARSQQRGAEAVDVLTELFE